MASKSKDDVLEVHTRRCPSCGKLVIRTGKLPQCYWCGQDMPYVRQHKRQRVTLALMFNYDNNTVSANTVDVSAGGARIYYFGDKILADSLITLDIPEAHSLHDVARIVWCEDIPPGKIHVAGIEYISKGASK